MTNDNETQLDQGGYLPGGGLMPMRLLGDGPMVVRTAEGFHITAVPGSKPKVFKSLEEFREALQ